MSESASPVLCGPSGWSFLTDPVVRGHNRHPLEFIAEHFDTVEVDGSFDQFPRPELTRVWLRKTAANPNFQFTAKLHRSFTHERILDPSRVSAFRNGLLPLLEARRFGCLLMQFPWSFRFTKENREFFILLRRAFREFPLAAEMRNASWMTDEAVGTFIDYHVGFCNIDQPSYAKAMPPTAFLTSPVGYVRLHGRNAFNWFAEEKPGKGGHRYDYLYSDAELRDWKNRITRISSFAARTFVITNNDAGPKALINGMQLRSMLRGVDRCNLPSELLRRYPTRQQEVLFSQYSGTAVA